MQPNAILEELEYSAENLKLAGEFKLRVRSDYELICQDAGNDSYYPAESSFHHRPLSSRVSRQRTSPTKRRERLPVPEVTAGLQDELDDGNERPRQLDGVPLGIQEAWICEDLGFVMQVGFMVCYRDILIKLKGVEGALVTYDEDYDPDDEAQRIRGVRWRVDPSLGETIPLRTTLVAKFQIHLCYLWYSDSFPWQHITLPLILSSS